MNMLAFLAFPGWSAFWSMVTACLWWILAAASALVILAVVVGLLLLAVKLWLEGMGYQ